MPKLDAASRSIVIARLEADESQNAVVARYNIHRSTISRLWQMTVHVLDVLASQIMYKTVTSGYSS